MDTQYQAGQEVRVLVHGEWLNGTTEYQIPIDTAGRELWKVNLDEYGGSFGDAKTGTFDLDHMRPR